MRRRAARVLLAALCLWTLPAPAAGQSRARTRDEYDDIFRKYSKRFFGPGFDWQYFKAQGMAESGLSPEARSPVGARGIMQLMPSTYHAIQTNRPDLKQINDPESNIAAGILYDRDLWRRWEDHQITEERLRFMFAGYNAGPGTLLRAKRVARERQLDERVWANVETVAPEVQRWRYRETLGYVRKIEDNYQQLRQDPTRANAAGPRR